MENSGSTDTSCPLYALVCVQILATSLVGSLNNLLREPISGVAPCSESMDSISVAVPTRGAPCPQRTRYCISNYPPRFDIA